MLGRPLHHDPTGGGDEAEDRYLNAYRATLFRYAEVFGESAPADIWPPPDRRFAIDEGYRSLRLGDWWVGRRLWSPQSGRNIIVR